MKNQLAVRQKLNEPEPALVPGSLLGGSYRLLRQLGRGGMGVLYLASHERIPGNFVVKVLPPGYQSEEAINGLRHEAVVLGTIHHPNVVRFIDFDWTDMGLPYLVMEFLGGEDLSGIVPQRRLLPVTRIMSIIRQVAHGLHAAHQMGIVHQDLKPSNIMIIPSEQGEDVVKIIDFGISKKVQPCSLVRDVALEGTPPFIAPEQVEGGNVGPACDQFALAVTSYALFTGRLPWLETTTIALLYSVVNRDPLPLNDDTLRTIEPVLQRGMAKDPQDRFPSVLAFWESLRWALSDAGYFSGARYPHTPAEQVKAWWDKDSTSIASNRNGWVRIDGNR